MNLSSAVLFVAQLCILNDVVVAKGGRGGGGRGGGRGSGGRGSSSSRGSSSRGGGSRGISGGGRVHSGRITGSTSRSIASNLASAYVGYRVGRTMSGISSGYHSSYMPAYGRTYYYGSRFYSAPPSPEYDTCTYHIESNDDYFDLTYNDTGLRVTEIMYTCNANTQMCCNGLDCCERGPSLTLIMFIAVLGIVCLVVLACIFRRCFKKSRKAETVTASSGSATYTYQPMAVNASSSSYCATKVSDATGTNVRQAFSGPTPAANAGASNVNHFQSPNSGQMPTYRPYTSPSTGSQVVSSGFQQQQQQPPHMPPYQPRPATSPATQNDAGGNFVPNFILVGDDASMPNTYVVMPDVKPPPYGFVVTN